MQILVANPSIPFSNVVGEKILGGQLMLFFGWFFWAFKIYIYSIGKRILSGRLILFLVFFCNTWLKVSNDHQATIKYYFLWRGTKGIERPLNIMLKEEISNNDLILVLIFWVLLWKKNQIVVIC